jgi:hypothetical protein
MRPKQILKKLDGVDRDQAVRVAAAISRFVAQRSKNPRISIGAGLLAEGLSAIEGGLAKDTGSVGDLPATTNSLGGQAGLADISSHMSAETVGTYFGPASPQ